MKFLIILLNYNNWKDTIECVESLQNSKVENSNILVVDNCSIDDSYIQLKNRIPDVTFLKTENNLGFSGGNNIGIRYGIENNAEYIILLNNDTIVNKDSIKNLINEMEKRLDITLGTGQIRYYHDKNKIWYAGGKLIPWRGLAVHLNMDKDFRKIIHPNKPIEIDFISGCFMCIRTEHIKDLGLLNDKFFIYLEDIEYSARAVNNNKKLMYVPNSIIYHKWRGETKLKYQTLYYAIRNRKLLINLVFPKYAKFYFNIVVLLKMVYWFLTDKELFKAAQKGLSDYKKKYFGQIKSIDKK